MPDVSSSLATSTRNRKMEDPLATKRNGHGQLNKRQGYKQNGTGFNYGRDSFVLPQKKQKVVRTSRPKQRPLPHEVPLDPSPAASISRFHQEIGGTRNSIRELCRDAIMRISLEKFFLKGPPELNALIPSTGSTTLRWDFAEGINGFMHEKTGQDSWRSILIADNVTFGELLDWMVETIKSSPRGRSYFS